MMRCYYLLLLLLVVSTILSTHCDIYYTLYHIPHRTKVNENGNRTTNHRRMYNRAIATHISIATPEEQHS